jgi:GNAT superfamily N-acetyltransferase
VTIRPAEESDKAFIFATWLKGLYHGNSFYSEIEKDAYFTNYHAVLERVLAKSSVLVACLTDTPDVVLGYAVIERGTVLHWVFVKKSWRRFGIAKRLIPHPILTVTHLTKLGSKLKPQEWAFNPFLI